MNTTEEKQSDNKQAAAEKSNIFTPPSIALPKGGGAIRGIGEKFAANPVTGTGSMTVPIATSPGRSGFGPQLALSYDSGAGNGPFGLGWNLSLPSITRKTDKGLPKYQDAIDSDVFILSGSEDLVPVLVKNGNEWIRQVLDPRTVIGITYDIQRYRPRIEGLFARIERWTNKKDPCDVFWRSISKDNITTLYGKTENSRIMDPSDHSHIFSWLICQTYDDKGNIIEYEYKPEDSDNIDQSQAHERNRKEVRCVNRYLKHIRYGNCEPSFADIEKSWPTLPNTDQWYFQVVFDFGEHDDIAPNPNEEITKWKPRVDPFSTYRAAFEIRTYRLCQRVLMFHHFKDEENVGLNCLVRSTDFTYSYEKQPDNPRNPIYSALLSVSQSGYKKNGNGYLKKSLPPLEFEYTEAIIDETVRDIDPESLENLPYGLDGTSYQFVDLDGEGLSGILTEQGEAWYYKRNLSPMSIVTKNEIEMEHIQAQFGPMELVAQKPSLAAISSGRQQLLDLAGDGQLDLVELRGPTPGFYERTQDELWESFALFTSLPVLDWNDPNLKFVDLTGDGHADILITKDDVFTWHPSLAEEGFDQAQHVHQECDEENGPRLLFADGTQSIYLADMSGDGLNDLVRISNGSISYWSSLGYGRFGKKVTMDNSPWFDNPDVFDQKRIRLADIDGSGTNDILYIGRDGLRIYFNLSGNGWSRPHFISQFPKVDDISAIMTADLLGNGTACLVWSSPLPGDVMQPMRYIDLMGRQKPHLLVKSINNLGAETHIHYAPSTKFYLQDKREGKPWVTKIPFPVHVVERVETYDRISHNRFVTRYSYKNGFYDGLDREWRGFGRVDQWDTEEFDVFKSDSTVVSNLSEASHVPPAHTKTWFHTGAFLGHDKISKLYSEEYYKGDVEAVELLDTALPPNLTPDEEREACRALKGKILRQEIYADDESDCSKDPYSVSEHSARLCLIQSMSDNRHAVFFAYDSETLEFHYERKLKKEKPNDPHSAEFADPRIGHQITLKVDEFGNVEKSAVIGYARRRPRGDGQPHSLEQTKTLIVYTENVVTNNPDECDWYRIGVPIESRTYEITGMPSEWNVPYMLDALQNEIKKSIEIQYEKQPNLKSPQKRLIEHVRTLYRDDKLTVSLPLKEVQSRALVFETYNLAFSSDLIRSILIDHNTNSLAPSMSELEQILLNDGHYVHLAENDLWWIPSGRQFYSPNLSDTADDELDFAKKNFFHPHRFQDPFGYDTILSYSRKLLLESTTDALQNRVDAKNDYRVLQPCMITDQNRNQSAVAFDVLGMVVGTAVMGKENQNIGDSLADFKADLSQDEIDSFFCAPKYHASTLLGNATTRIIYDPDRFKNTGTVPFFAATLARETHVSDLVPSNKESKIQISFSYSDSFGREIQKKIQAEPGPVVEGSPPINPRWVGSGWKVFNNKGKPIRQYEPFFSPTHDFESDKKVGVSSILFYDPVDRVVATLHPNHSYEKVVFDAWMQTTSDVNDTVDEKDPRNDADVSTFFNRLPESEFFPTWFSQRIDNQMGNWEKEAAIKAAAHAKTPSIAHFDTLGRTFMTEANNGLDKNKLPQKYQTHLELDIEGNQRTVTDAQNRIVIVYEYDMLGNPIHQSSMEAGARWILNDVEGKSIYSWDNRAHEFRTEYDELRRPVSSFVRGTDRQDSTLEILFERLTYGDRHDTSMDEKEVLQANLRGKPYKHYDTAGLVINVDYDFKGNLLHSTRQLLADYNKSADWKQNPAMETEIFMSSTLFDALNRVSQQVVPHSNSPGTKLNIIQPKYNEANLLEKIDAWLQHPTQPAGLLNPETASLHAVTNIDYNAKGQRVLIEYGILDRNKKSTVKTEYDYDRETFRLVRLTTTRKGFPVDESVLQDLQYSYDPAGNITHIQDDADIHNVIYFRNKRVEPSADYVYDAIYRLVRATGREHLGQTGDTANDPKPHSYNDAPRVNPLHPNDGNAMGTYTEEFVYDAVGNICEIKHCGSNPSQAGWTRIYTYKEPSLFKQDEFNNRLTKTTIGDLSELYNHDDHGNMTSMPHLQVMKWDFKDQLQLTQRQAVNDEDDDGKKHRGERTYYLYDSSGQRVRKVTDGQNGTRIKERIYVNSFEIYREYNGERSAPNLERETLHIMDDKQRVAMVETRTQGIDDSIEELIRYQFANHLGSASLELNDVAQIISYEEYYPYGGTSYYAVRTLTHFPNRYRYIGKERDEESGLSYHGARYYAPWLGVWASCDPARFIDGTNLYSYSKNSPTVLKDPKGLAAEDDPVLAKLRRSVNQLTKKQSEYQSVKDKLQNKISALADKVSEFKSRLQKEPRLANDLSEAQQKLHEAVEKQTAVESKMQQVSEQLKEANIELESYKEAITAARDPYKDLEAEAKLKELKKTIKGGGGGSEGGSSGGKGGGGSQSPPEGGPPQGSSGIPPGSTPSGRARGNAAPSETPQSSKGPEINRRVPGQGKSTEGFAGGVLNVLFWIGVIHAYFEAKTTEEKVVVAVETSFWLGLARVVGGTAATLISVSTVESDNPRFTQQQNAEVERLIQSGEWQCKWIFCGPTKK